MDPTSVCSRSHFYKLFGDLFADRHYKTPIIEKLRGTDVVVVWSQKHVTRKLTGQKLPNFYGIYHFFSTKLIAGYAVSTLSSSTTSQKGETTILDFCRRNK